MKLLSPRFYTTLGIGLLTSSASWANICGKPNKPYHQDPKCDKCEEETCENGSDQSSTTLGPSVRMPSGTVVTSLDLPNDLIAVNHGGALLSTTDLQIPGSPHGLPLQFSRFYQSRDADGFGDLMGHGRTWSHSYSWRMTAAGSERRVFFPSGRMLEFTLSGSSTYLGQASQLYQPTTGFGERLHQIGNFWHVVMPGGVAHTFERVVRSDGAVLFHPRSSRDSRGNIHSYTTNTAARITKVTDAAGNSLTLTYASHVINRRAAVTLHTISAAPVVGWNEVIIPAGASYRWIQAVSAQDAYFDVSEIKFYQSNGSGGYTLLGGTAYGTDPAFDDGPNTFANVFDNDGSTRFQFCRPNNGIAGLDLGNGGNATVTRIRYHIMGMFSGELSKFIGMRFEGMTEQPESTTVLASVTASTGQSMEFQYGTHHDDSVGQNYSVLEKVIYRDASNAVTDEANFSWVTAQEGSSPALERCREPRRGGPSPDISFTYYPAHVSVKGQPSHIYQGAPGVGPLILASVPQATHSFSAPDGGIHSVVDGNQTFYRPTSSTDPAGMTTTYAWTASRFLASRTTPAGTTSFTRNTLGQPLTITHPNGLVETFTYDSLGRLLTKTQSATGYASRTTSYNRDANGRITRITYPDTFYQDYTYNALGLVATIRETNGSFTRHTYDTTVGSPTRGLRLSTTRGLASATATTGGETETFTYHAPGNASGSPARLLASSTDPRGRTTFYQYDYAGRNTRTTYPDGSYRQNFYDEVGNKIRTFDGSATEDWTYDNFRRPLTHTDPFTKTTTFAYGINGTPCSCFGSGQPTLITTSGGRQTRRTYDLKGRLTQEIQGFGTLEAATTTHTRDVLGRITSTTGPDGHITQHTYNSIGLTLSTTIAPFGINLTTSHTYSPFGETLTTTLPGARTTTMAYDTMGRAVSIHNAVGTITNVAFDLGGRRTTLTEAVGTPLSRTTQYTYDALDRLTLTTYPDTTTVSQTYHPGGEPHIRTDELGHTTTTDSTLVTWADSLSQSWTTFARTNTDHANNTTTHHGPPMSYRGGTTKVISPAGRISESFADAMGRTILTRTGLVASGSGLTADITDTVTTYDDDGNALTTTIDPGGLNQTTTRVYDALNRVTDHYDPLSRRTRYFYNKRGLVTKTILSDNRENLATYDALGRILTTTDPKSQVTTYTYFRETSQIATLKDSRNQTTTWTHNNLGQTLTKVYQNGNTHTYTYDALHRVKTHKTPKNETCTYTYDTRDRQTLADWNTTTPDTTKTYWANGLIKSIDNGVSQSDYAYDVRNLLTSETQTLSGGGILPPSLTISYSYDADGLRLQMNSPSGSPVDYTWTAKAQLNDISRDGPPPLANYTYDKAGRLDLLAHENTISEDLTHDNAGQLLNRIHKKSGTPTSGHAYTIDTTGRRTAETFSDGTTTARTYGYDNADQVTSATYASGVSDAYKYDAMGNRTSATLAINSGTTTSYTANNVNQYTAISGFSAPVHDPNGNLTFQNGITYTWDSENRLLSVTDGTTTNTFTYDGHHRRVTKRTTVSGFVTKKVHYLYDGWNVIEERTNTDATSTFNLSTFSLTRTLTWGNDLSGSLQGAGGVGGLLMAEEITSTTTTAYHYHYDGYGNVTEVTDSSGNPAATYRYDAFGNTLVATGTYATTNKYRFSTKPIDEEITTTPLYYYGYRYYAPITGRWPSRDPIEERGGINLYGFVGNNAITSADYLGLFDTYSEALDAAKYEVGSGASLSRNKGLDDIRKHFGLNLTPPYRGLNYNTGLLSTSDAKLIWVNNNPMTRATMGVAGIEYSAAVFCCNDPVKKYDFVSARGSFGDEAAMASGNRGNAPILLAPEGCTLLARLHSHTHAPVFGNTDGRLSSVSNFLPINSLPSDVDIRLRNYVPIVEHYLVHEHFGWYTLYTY